ncbi:MAG TPA: chromosomal replication initiator protein DnaA [Trueperaceae bacterium]|nr:chromosomal replication initiator protein DnaA [Trueperaceae bacterium]
MAAKLEGMWDDVIALVRAQIPEVEFRTWFAQVTPHGFVDGAFVLAVPHGFARDWLRTNYTEVIEEALRGLGMDSPKVTFQVVPTQVTEQRDMFSAPPIELVNSEKPIARKPTLNPKYVFANFVVGPNNNLANAAARAVVEAPGRAYNPLFLYGEAGLGKTHLMHAVGHAAFERQPNLQVEYVTTEAFTNDLITAIREDRMTQFRDRYRTIDVLLIDDIQFIAGKERTQEEFFHTFNALYESGKQLIVSSDRPPKDIPTLEKRLRSRFEWGLITDIQAPELETRIAILAMNAEYRGVKVPAEVIDYIARHVTSNIRELEGALVRAIVYSSMNQSPLNRQTVAKALSDVFAPSEIALTMPDILKRTADHFGVKPDDVRGKGRRQELVVPRQIAMFLIRELTTHSYPEIGGYFSGRDHSTVMYAVQKIQNTSDSDSDLARAVRSIRETLV